MATNTHSSSTAQTTVISTHHVGGTGTDLMDALHLDQHQTAGLRMCVCASVCALMRQNFISEILLRISSRRRVCVCVLPPGCYVSP